MRKMHSETGCVNASLEAIDAKIKSASVWILLEVNSTQVLFRKLKFHLIQNSPNLNTNSWKLNKNTPVTNVQKSNFAISEISKYVSSDNTKFFQIFLIWYDTDLFTWKSVFLIAIQIIFNGVWLKKFNGFWLKLVNFWLKLVNFWLKLVNFWLKLVNFWLIRNG